MINERDLRIGNIVGMNDSGITDEICVSEILTISNVGNYFCDLKYNKPSALLIGGYFGCFVNDLTPIPITEKILLQCGFEFNRTLNNYPQIEIGKYYESKDYCVFGISITNKVICEINLDLDIEIKYLHELQNLYYALNKTELPIDINTFKL